MCHRLGVDWESAVSGDLLELHGLPALLSQKGISDLELEGAPSITWSYAGLYEVRINGGGLISLLPKRPRSVVFSVGRIDIREIVKPGSHLALGGDATEGFINPLGWRPRVPALVEEAPPGKCVTVDSRKVVVPDLEPLHVAEPIVCPPVAFAAGEERLSIGQFSLSLSGKVARSQGMTVIASERLIAAATGSNLYLTSEDVVKINIGHPYHDFRISHLSVLSFFERWSHEEELRSNAIVIGGPVGSLALSSPSGLSARIRRGVIELEARELVVSAGGEQEGFRGLIEAAVTWRPATVGAKPLGHVRSFSAVAVLASLSAEGATLCAQNPFSSDGLVEVRLYHRLRGASISYAREVLEAVPMRGIVTAPLPRGSSATIELRFGRGLRA